MSPGPAPTTHSFSIPISNPFQGAFSSKLEKVLVELYLREKALFWGASTAAAGGGAQGAADRAAAEPKDPVLADAGEWVSV